MELLNPRVDVAFKKIFGSEENKDLLISFINSVVSHEDQVIDVELLNPYNSRNFGDDKLSILDIKAKDIFGNFYNIEVQICNDGDYDQRSLYYWAKLYTDQISIGDPYTKLRKAVAIHVINFISVPDAPNYCNRFVITNEETHLRHFKDLAIYTIELAKFNREKDETLPMILPRIKTSLDRWAAFLTRASSLDRNALPKELDDPCIKRAVDVLTHVSLNKQERELYEGHLKWMRTEASALATATAKGLEQGMAKGLEEGLAKGLEEGLAKGLEEGLAKGSEEKAIAIAMKLFNQEMDIALISTITGLPYETLLKLKDRAQCPI